MKKQQQYTTFVSLCGIAVFGAGLYQSAALFADPQSLWNTILYCVVMVALLSLCHMLPIYITADKTMEISFVPVVACIVTKGVALSIVLYVISSMLVFLHDPQKRKYYSPWLRSPLKELFNVSNVLVANWIGGSVYNLIAVDANGSVFSWHVVIGAVAFSFIAIFGNLVFFILYYKLGDEGRFFALLRDNIGGIIPNILATVPLGLMIGYLLMQENAYLWIILFMGPLLLARYSFKVYLDSHMILLRTVASLVEAIEAKDPYTHGHSQRVAYISTEICKAMKCSRSFTDQVKMAALLHDTGKIGVEDAVLRKPGPLTTEEYDIIKQHPVVGRRIIESINLSNVVNDAVLYHHHRYDAAGYPEEGPAPGELPLSAAILAVADTYDAIISDRPYRAGLTKERAREILLEVSGSQLNPEVVKTFLAIEPNLRPEDADKFLLYTV
ncbi:MAG: HD domain-containing protein [Eubacteriales bacterium]|nr:HD domain-containing protein [Eubacteriales bacterium]